MKKAIIRVVLVLVIGGAVYGSYRLFKQTSQQQSDVATAKVRQSDVVVRAFTRGELRAVRSQTLMAPNLFGTVQVTRIAPLGSFAKEKDLIVEFDDSERRSALEEDLLGVDQIDEQIKKSQADLEMRHNQDQVDLLRANYSVRRAELQVKQNPLLAEIDQKKNVLNLEEAQKRLEQLKSDIKSRQDQAEAQIAVLREQRNKSMLDVSRERARIATAKVLSPISGLVALRQNRGSVMTFGQAAPDIREGDIVQPGTPIADVLDLSEMEVVAKVGELDRANLSQGQDVKIRLDAIPEKVFNGKIKSMSGTATANPWAGDPAKKFDVLFSVDMSDLMKALGATPEQIRKVQETAALNAKKAPANSSSFGSMGGGMVTGGGFGGPAGGPPDAMGGANAGGDPSGGGGGGGGRGGRGGRGPGGGGAASPEQRQAQFARMMENVPPAAKQEIQKMLGKKTVADLTSEERQKLFAKIRELAPNAGGGRGGRGGGGQAVDPKAEEERNNAQLPPAPEEDSQLQVLLRPGLLADVEIIVERIPNAVHIPSQAIFDRDGRSVVYVQNGNRFEEREVKPLKRSESVVVISEGLKANEVIAMSDPTASKDTGTKKGEKKKGAAAMPTMPGGR
jgi:multidrug resistance efflux pump